MEGTCAAAADSAAANLELFGTIKLLLHSDPSWGVNLVDQQLGKTYLNVCHEESRLMITFCGFFRFCFKFLPMFQVQSRLAKGFIAWRPRRHVATTDQHRFYAIMSSAEYKSHNSRGKARPLVWYSWRISQQRRAWLPCGVGLGTRCHFNLECF